MLIVNMGQTANSIQQDQSMLSRHGMLIDRWEQVGKENMGRRGMEWNGVSWKTVWLAYYNSGQEPHTLQDFVSDLFFHVQLLYCSLLLYFKAEKPRRETQYSEETGRLIPPPSRATACHSSRRLHRNNAKNKGKDATLLFRDQELIVSHAWGKKGANRPFFFFNLYHKPITTIFL